jgi:hypothetical protein
MVIALPHGVPNLVERGTGKAGWRRSGELLLGKAEDAVGAGIKSG